MVGVPVICVKVAVGLLAVAVVVAVGYLDDESVSRWWRRWVLDSSGTDDGDEVAAEKPKKNTLSIGRVMTTLLHDIDDTDACMANQTWWHHHRHRPWCMLSVDIDQARSWLSVSPRLAGQTGPRFCRLLRR